MSSTPGKQLHRSSYYDFSCIEQVLRDKLKDKTGQKESPFEGEPKISQSYPDSSLYTLKYANKASITKTERALVNGISLRIAIRGLDYCNFKDFRGCKKG